MTSTPPFSYMNVLCKAKSLLMPSLTISLAYFAQALIISTDVLMLGWLGVEQLAASGFVGRLFMIGFLMVIGISITVLSLAGRAIGANDRISARRIIQQIFWVACTMAILSAVTMWLVLPWYLSLIAPPEHIKQYAHDYGVWIWASLPFAGLVSFQRLYMSLLKRTSPFVIIGFVLVGVNAILDYVLIFGFWFIPALGIKGASIATFIVSLVHMVALIWCIQTMKPYTKYRIFTGLFSPKIFALASLQVRNILSTGLPISVRMVGESLLASVYYIIVATQGTNFAAAYQAATQVETMISLFAIGISITLISEMGRAIGTKSSQDMVMTIVSALVLLMCIMLPLAIGLFVFSEPLAILFLPDADATTIATRSILVKMFGLVALFHSIRLIQVIIMGAFEGMGDTKRSSSMLLATMWCVGGIGGYALSLTTLSAYGVMVAHILAMVVGILWIGRLLYQELLKCEQQFISQTEPQANPHVNRHGD